MSDWNGTHPFAAAYLGPRRGQLHRYQPADRYIYPNDDDALLESIGRRHRAVEGVKPKNSNIVVGSGSSPLLAAICFWLGQRRTERVCYFAPMYYTTHYFLRLLGLRPRRLAERHLFDLDELPALPKQRSVLVLCDPIWYAGVRVTREHMRVLATWQQATGSLVIVDGSFQFMQWDSERTEHSAMLDPDLTMRVICPAKALALPSVRFAYALVPAAARDELMFLSESMSGSSSAADMSLARRTMKVLGTGESNRKLTDYLRQTYEALVADGLVRTNITPECGYFVFARFGSRVRRRVGMDQHYFELTGYRGYARLNLLVADRLREMTS